ncbi:protein of unknown function [Rhizobiales bacterium GAS188]|nr:protein of unknown function [Rhizobiales bacterium GAS188]
MHSFTHAAMSRSALARHRGTGAATARPRTHSLQRSLGNDAVRHIWEQCALAPPSGAALAEGEVPSIVEETLSGPSQQLDPAVRAEMESRFGRDFGEVRIHVGGDAATSASAVNAKAYAVGQHVVFGTGNYAPGTVTGRELLAHELAHVVQQGRGGAAPSLASESYLEAGAEQAAIAATRGGGPVDVSGASGVGLARQPQDSAQLLRRGYPHTVTFKNMDEFARSNAAPPMVVNEDGTVTATVLLPYPESSLATPAAAPPAPKQAPKPKPKAKPPAEAPVDPHVLLDYLEATRPRLIYPKPVRQFFGGLQFVGGGLEAGIGGVGGVATAETGVGLLGGLFLLGHGADVASSGWHTMLTGEESTTYTFMAGAGWAYAAGADPKLANAIGQSTDLIANVGSAGLTLKLGAAPFTIAEEAPSYRVVFYHGRVSGRDVVTVDTPSGPRAFYARTGGGGTNVGGAQPGEWAPFEGFSSQRGAFQYKGNIIGEIPEGWFVKHRFAIGLEETSPLYRFGTEENLEISKWLGTQSIPTGGATESWRAVQSEIEFFGVPTIDPIPYYGRIKISF